MADQYDLFILGSGSTAFAAAIRASELGATVGMAERRTLGGTCANRGCLPSKNLIEAARIVWEAGHPRYGGLAPAEIQVDFPVLIEQKDEVVRDYRQKKYRSVADGMTGLELLEGDARLVGSHTVAIGDGTAEAANILIATGSRPRIPQLPGVESVPYLTSDLLDADEVGRMTELPTSMIVVGGGYIAVELAQMFSRLGSRVTVVQRSNQLLTGYEPELGTTLAEIFVAQGIEVLTGARIAGISGDEREVCIDVELPSGGRTLNAARLLLATGRRPNTDGIGLETAGVALDPEGFIIVDAELRTIRTDVWAAGDVIGRQHHSQMATPVGARQGRIVADNAFAGARRKFDGTVIPRAIFVDPPIGVVGMTEAEVIALHLPAVTATAPLTYVPRAGAIHKTDGFVKTIASMIDERILGVHLIGESASEIIHEAAMAMHFKATINDLVDLIHVYPTMSEALKIGAQAFSKDVSKLSCCAE